MDITEKIEKFLDEESTGEPAKPATPFKISVYDKNGKFLGKELNDAAIKELYPGRFFELKCPPARRMYSRENKCIYTEVGKQRAQNVKRKIKELKGEDE